MNPPKAAEGSCSVLGCNQRATQEIALQLEQGMIGFLPICTKCKEEKDVRHGAGVPNQGHATSNDSAEMTGGRSLV